MSVSAYLRGEKPALAGQRAGHTNLNERALTCLKWRRRHMPATKRTRTGSI